MTSRDPGKFYLVRGSTLDRIDSLLDDLWSGNNIQRGPGIRLRKGGKNAGLMIAASAVASPPATTSGPSPTWTFKVYNTSQGTTGQVQINGDGLVAQLNGAVAKVNGVQNDTPTAGAYPQLAITGNGVVYAYASLSSGAITSLDIYYGGSLPGAGSSDPPTYGVALLATITNYSSGKFSVNNAQSTGLSNLVICGTAVTIF